MLIEYVPIEELKAAEYNPRRMSDEQFEKLKKGLSEFGYVEPLVVNADNTVISGHQRLRASIDLGLEAVPCVRMDVDKVREKALNLALNRIQGEWDLDGLAVILSELSAIPDFDIELTGFNGVDVSDLAELDAVFDALPGLSFGGRGPTGSAALLDDRLRSRESEDGDTGGFSALMPTAEHLGRMFQRYFKDNKGFALIVREAEGGRIEYVATKRVPRTAVEKLFRSAPGS